MEKDIKCNNNGCPINKHCQTYSEDSLNYDLVVYEFDVASESDEQEINCKEYLDMYI